MDEAARTTLQSNPYDRMHDRLIERGTLANAVLEHLAAAYIDGVPKKRVSGKERDRHFWSCDAVRNCPPDAWNAETMVLALSRYLRQEDGAVGGLLMRVAREAPAALLRAVRHSGLVLKEHSPRRKELDEAAAESDEIAELCKVLGVFDRAYRQRFGQVEYFKSSLDELSAFELLLYASLYAFQNLVPRNVSTASTDQDASDQCAWDAIGKLFAWKLSCASEASLSLDDRAIGESLAKHLRPVLFEQPGPREVGAHQRLSLFTKLMEAQIELDEFIGRSADAFSYDDGVRFTRDGERLALIELDPSATANWEFDGRKLDRLHVYWMYRAIDAFVESGLALSSIGRPESADTTRLAWIRSMQARLRLTQVYGIADEVVTESGATAPLFQSLLTSNLMSAFYLDDFLHAFARLMQGTKDWRSALRELMLQGLQEGMQNRLPIVWSDREAKAHAIRGWTLTPDHPAGSARVAEALLDFWTYDTAVVAKRLRRKKPGGAPDLFERPILKFDRVLVQLPGIVGQQNNMAAAINSLRRIGGARRGAERAETKRIEANVAAMLEARGFRVVLNWIPPERHKAAGELDLLAARDGHLFVLEIKSTYLRRSQKDVWLHKTNTLRKAGQQLRRKFDAVTHLLGHDADLRSRLGLDASTVFEGCHAWIVDTSIEADHERFDGFLKISVEELLIALRDDRHLLDDPGGLYSGRWMQQSPEESEASMRGTSMYPGGFNAARLVEVIESGMVWQANA